MNGWLIVGIAVLSLALGVAIVEWMASRKAEKARAAAQVEWERQQAERAQVTENWRMAMEASKRARQEAQERIREEVEQMDPDELAAAVDAGVDLFRNGRGVTASGTTDTGGAGNHAG